MRGFTAGVNTAVLHTLTYSESKHDIEHTPYQHITERELDRMGA